MAKKKEAGPEDADVPKEPKPLSPDELKRKRYLVATYGERKGKQFFEEEQAGGKLHP